MFPLCWFIVKSANDFLLIIIWFFYWFLKATSFWPSVSSFRFKIADRKLFSLSVSNKFIDFIICGDCEGLIICINTFKYHVFAPMGRFQLELIYLYFPPSFHHGRTVENVGKLILIISRLKIVAWDFSLNSILYSKSISNT